MKKETVPGTLVTLGLSTGACGRRVQDQIVDQGAKIAIAKERNIEARSGGRIRVGSDGRSRCLRWSGVVDLEREGEVSGDTTMMDTGENYLASPLYCC